MNKSNKRKARKVERRSFWRSSINGSIKGVVLFLLGLVVGPIIQQGLMASMPGPGVSAGLRIEHPANLNKGACSFYLFHFTNFAPINSVYVELQFPDPVTSVKIGDYTVIGRVGDESQGGLLWGKGRDSKGRCAVLGTSLAADPDVQYALDGNTLRIHSSSELPFGAKLVSQVATTYGKNFQPPPGESEVLPSHRLRLLAHGVYEYSEFGEIVRKNLAIKIE